MNSEWSLDVLYKGFDDPKFSEDLTSFEKKAKELDELSKTLSHENEKEDLLQIVKVLEEFELLEMLIKNRGKILRREMLLDKIWGYEYIGETRTVDVHIRYLRKKIEDDDKNPKFIETIRGVGYRFNPDL